MRSSDTPAFSSRLAGLASGFLLPLALLLLPILILRYGARWEQEQQRVRQERRLRDDAVAAGAKLQQTMRASYWVEQSARRLVETVERRLGRSTEPVSGLTLGETISEALPDAGPSEVPEFRLWAITLPDAGREPELCRGEGLESVSGRLLTRLLAEMARDAMGEPSELASGLWKQRLEQMFGYGCAEHFQERFRGRAFAVVLHGEGGMACWDFLVARGRRVGLFLAVSPLQDDRRDLLSRLVFKNWSAIAGPGAPLPVLLPVPTPPAPVSMPLFHPDLMPVREQLAPMLQRVFHRLTVAPGIPWREDYVCGLIRTGAKTPREAGDHFLGRVVLPVELLREEVSLPGEPWSGVLLPPVMRSGMLVFMVQPKSESAVGVLTFLADLAVQWWLIAALILLAQRVLGTVPALSVRASLLLWLLVLGAIPLSHSIVVLAQWQIDEEQLLLTNLRERLFRRLGLVESRYLTFQQARQQACRTFFQETSGNKGLGERLRRVQYEGADARPLQQEVWNYFRDQGLPLSALLILGHDDYILRLFEPGLPSGVGSTLEILIRSAIMHELDKRRPPSLAPRAPGDQAPLIMDRISRNSDYGRQQLGQFVNWGAGTRKAQGYADWIKIGEESWYILYALWNAETLMQGFLASLQGGDDELNQCWLLVRSGNMWLPRPGDRVPEELLQSARQLGERSGRVALQLQGRLCAFQATPTLPGYLLVTWDETAPILQRVRRELLISLSVWVLLAICIGFGVSLVASRLTAPVIEMTTGLKRVAADDLAFDLETTEGGELGDTARSLNTMIGWLRERRNMSRFVSPDVLEAVREQTGHVQAASPRRTVAMLISDIRSFTEMSERFPPQQVFGLLNEHLKRMTIAIQRQGGMIDRFIGDAIQAVFPGATVQHALLAAATAAREMRLLQREYHEQRLREGLFGYEIGIGIAGGEVAAGVVGDPESRLDFSLIGKPLQQAAELEAASKIGRDSKIMISAQDATMLPAEWISDSPVETSDIRELRSRARADTSTSTDENKPAIEDESGEYGRESTTAHDAARRFGTLAWLFLWLIPPLLVMWFQHWSREEHLAAAREGQKRVLERDEQRVRVMTAGRGLEEWYLWRRFESQLGTTHGGTVLDALQKSSILAELENELPGLSWYVGDGTRVTASGGVDVGLAPDRMDALMRAVHDELHAIGGSRGQDQMIGGNGIGLEAFLRRDLGYQMCGRLIQIQTPAGTRWMFWRPISRSKTVTWRSNNPVFASAGRKAEKIDADEDNIGDLVLLLNEAALMSLTQRRPQILLEGFASLGLFLKSGRAMAPGFPESLSANILSAPAAVRRQSASSVVVFHGDWAGTTAQVPLFGSDTLILARRTSTHLLGWLTVLIPVWGALWLSVGALLRLAPSARLFLPDGLKLRLITAFGLALSPVLFLSLVNVERRWAGHAVREADAREELFERRMQQVDESFQMTEEACGGCLKDIFELPEVRTRLQEIRARSGRRRLDEMSRLMARFGELSRQFGWYCHLQRLIIADGTSASGVEHRTAERRIDGREALLLYIGRTLLKQWRTDETSTGVEKPMHVWIAASAEDALTMFRGFFPPDDVPGMLLMPYSGIRPWGQGEAAVMSIVKAQDRALAWLFASMPNTGLWRQHFRQWFDAAASASWSVTACLEQTPMLRLANPVMQGYVEDSRGEKLALQPLVKAQAAAEVWGALLARETGEGILVVPEDAEIGESVFMKPLPRLKGLIGRLYDSSTDKAGEAARARLADIGASFAGLVGGVLLALLAAQTFLRPLLRLQQAARAVTNEQFDARLPVEGGNEFTELSRAFNQMAAGIAEGRELRRYVSLSVRQAAVGAGSDGIGTARATEAVIVFGALHEFRSRSESLDASLLMPRLRAHLAAWAGAVRQTGGDIDKFIGERILGVFLPDKLGGMQAAVRAAVRTVQLMTSRPVDPMLGSRLGIGVAAGPVLEGIMGTPRVRLEYTVVGDTVNLASRLADTALQQTGGGVVVDSGFVDLCRAAESELLQSWNPQPLEIRRVKGKSRDVEIHFIPASRIATQSS